MYDVLHSVIMTFKAVSRDSTTNAPTPTHTHTLGHGGLDTDDLWLYMAVIIIS